MSSFFGGGNAAASSSSASEMQARKENMKQQIQQELAVANAQQLINKMNENCFAKCIPRPSTSLSSGEQHCLSSCVTLYMSAFDATSRSYVNRISKERSAASVSGAAGAGLDGGLEML